MKKLTEIKKYYRYCGYEDGSGRPGGYVIKCYTQEEHEYYTKRCKHVLIEMNQNESNGDHNSLLR